MKTRDSLREHLDICYLSTDEDRRLLDSELPLLLNTTNVRKICSFFDRNNSVFKWHYTMYARDSSDGPVNTITSIVSGEQVVRGPAVIVKDCPEHLWKELETKMNADTVAATLWYYHKSGVSPEEEFGERTLIRILGSQAP